MTIQDDKVKDKIPNALKNAASNAALNGFKIAIRRHLNDSFHRIPEQLPKSESM